LLNMLSVIHNTFLTKNCFILVGKVATLDASNVARRTSFSVQLDSIFEVRSNLLSALGILDNTLDLSWDFPTTEKNSL